MVRRLGAVVAVVLLAGFVAATVPAGAGAQVVTPAERALNGTLTQEESARFFSELKKRYGGMPPGEFGELTEGQKRNWLKRVMRGRLGARLLPLAPGIGRLVLVGSGVGTAGLVGYTVYQLFSDGSRQTIDLWLDHRLLGKNALYNPKALPDQAYGLDAKYSWQHVEWQFRTGVGLNGCPASLGFEPCGRLALRMQMTPYVSSWADEWPQYVYNDVGVGQVESGRVTWWQTPDLDECITLNNCVHLRSGRHAVKPENYRLHMQYGITKTIDAVTDGRDIGGGPVERVQTVAAGKVDNNNYDVGPLYGAYITADQFLEMMGPTAEQVSAGRASTIAATDNRVDYTVPADQGTPADQMAAADEFADECGQAYLNHSIQPLSYPDFDKTCIANEPVPDTETETEVMELLQPEAGETYDDYLARLQAEGYVGTATRVDLTEETGDPRMGPEGVVRLRVQTSQGVQRTFQPLAWPSTSPTIRNDADITLHVNPDTYAPTTGAGGGGVGSCDGYIEATPDFSPLLDIEYGEVFPFGLVPWALSLLDDLAASPVAPSWSFDFDWLGIDEDYTINLDAFDAYMSTIRTLLSWVMWVGAVWLAATSLLGIRNSGDPGEAVDEFV